MSLDARVGAYCLASGNAFENEMWSQRRRSCRRSGKCGHMARRVRPPTEECGHTSLFRCMVALWLASQSLAPANGERTVFGAESRPMRTLPAASVVEIKAAIERREPQRVVALTASPCGAVRAAVAPAGEKPPRGPSEDGPGQTGADVGRVCGSS